MESIMDPSTCVAESIMERLKNGTQDQNFIKKDVENFFRNLDDCRSRSEFANKFLNKLSQFITIRLKNGTPMSGSNLKDFVDTVVVCHDQIFNRGYDCSEEENSQIGRNLYAALYSIAEQDLKQAIVLSDLLLKSFSRNHQIPRAANIGSIVRNSFLILWNASVKLDHLPAQALRHRQIALTHLSLSDDPKSATKFCDRALNAALMYNGGGQKWTERESNILGRFTCSILDLFRNRLLLLLGSGEGEEAQTAVKNLVKLVHVNVNQQQRNGRLDDNNEWLSKVTLLLDATNNFEKFRTNTGSLEFSFDILDFALAFMKTVSKNSTAQLTNKIFDRLIAYVTSFRTTKFTQFDENCFGIALTTLRYSFYSILEKASIDSAVIQPLVPFFDRIVSLLTFTAECGALISPTGEDPVFLMDSLIVYESHYSRCIADADEDVFKEDLRIMTSTLETFHRVVFRSTKNRSEGIAKFIERLFRITAVPYQKKMYAEVVGVVHRYAEELMESFESRETSSQNQAFWKRMGILVQSLIKSHRFHDALQLLAMFFCKGHVESDCKTVALWAYVLREARFQQVDTVKKITIPELVTKFCPVKTTFSRTRMSFILAEEIAILKTQLCPVDELYPVLCDLLKFAKEPFHKYSTLIHLARILLGKSPQYDYEGRTASDCCKQALDLLNDPVTQRERWFAVQANFVTYLVRLREIYECLDHKVTHQRERKNQLLQIQQKEMEKLSAAAVAAAADHSDQPDDLVQDSSDFASYQPSNMSDELKCMSELDECVGAWMAILDDDADEDHTEVVQCVEVVLKDLKLAAEIYSNSRIFRREIVVRELYVKLAKRHGKWMEFIKGSSQLVYTLARIGLVDVAEKVLTEAASNADRLKCESKSAEAITQTSIYLQLAHSELRLMQGRVMDGFQHLCSATYLIQAEKRYKAVMLLEGRSLLLISKYRELVSSDNFLLSPLEYASDAVRVLLGLLKSCAENNQVESFSAELIGCLLDSSLQLSRLFYDVGLLRDARLYLREQMTWSQRFFCVSRTAEILLLSARIALDIGEISDCQTKLNAVRHVVDAKDGSGQSLNKLCPPSPLAVAQDLSESFDADNFLSSPIRTERVLAKLEPESNLKTSPSLWPSSSSSETITQFDFVSFDGHPMKCPCSWCCNMALIRIRAEFILMNYELAGSPRVDGILKRVKLLAHNEKRLLKKMSASSAVSSTSFLPSQIDISTCWMLSRVVDGLLDAKNGVRASKLLSSASKLLSKVQVGLSLLNFLQTTLTYQECLCMLIVEASKTRKRSVSELCEPAWSHNRIVDSFGLQRLTVDFSRFGFSENAKTPGREFKTPRRPAMKLEERNGRKFTANLNVAFSESSSDTTTKRIGCRAPARTTTKSFFQHNFEDEDDSDVIEVIYDSNVEKKASSDVDAQSEDASAKKRQLEKLKRHAVPIIIISDKENSDVDDLMSPPIVEKKMKKAAAGRVLRSKAKIKDLELGDIADSEESDNSNVKAKKARKSPKVKHLFGSPLETSSRINFECPRDSEKKIVTRRITRSNALMKDAQEVECFRAKSPMGMYRLRVKDRRPIIEPPNYTDEVQDDFEIERHFDMDDIVRKLDEALQSIVRFPRLPLYSDLNILLALCKGDKTRADLRNGVEHILESVSVSFRHSADLRLRSSVNNSSAVSQKDLDRHRILSHTGGSMLSKDDGDEGIQRVTNKLPKGWVVCQMNALPNVFSGDSSNPELILTRLENGKRPIMVKLENSCKNVVVRDIFSEFEAILSENKQNMRISTRKEWWEVRRALDTRLKTYLSSMEDTILGAWKCLFLGGRAAQEHRSQLKEVMREVTKQLNDSLSICSVDEHLLELVLDCWPSLKDRTDCWRPAVAHACCLTDVADSKIEKVYSVFNVLTTKLSYDVNRHVMVLVLDKFLHDLPWENIPVLRNRAVTRMPSIHALLGHLFLHADIQSVPECPKVDTSNSFYVLNPSKDLVRTETFFTPIFENLKWSGITNQGPTTTEWTNALIEKNLFVYCGHGTGSLFAGGDKIDKTTCRAVSLLMGCSSARLKSQGMKFEPFGIIHNYLLAGCPYVMGNLWDVTDRDIDRFLAALLKHWIPGSEQKCNSLAHNLPTARLETFLCYIIGAAPVAYGIPVYSS